VAFGRSASAKLKEIADEFVDLEQNPQKFLIKSPLIKNQNQDFSDKFKDFLKNCSRGNLEQKRVFFPKNFLFCTK